MYKIGNITFDCFVMAKNTTIIIDHNKVQIIIKLLKKAKETVKTDHTFSFYLALDILNPLFGIFSSCVWQKLVCK